MKSYYPNQGIQIKCVQHGHDLYCALNHNGPTLLLLYVIGAIVATSVATFIIVLCKA